MLSKCPAHSSSKSNLPSITCMPIGCPGMMLIEITGGCEEKNDRRYIELYRALAVLGRKIQVGMHIARYRYLSRRSFFSQTPV